MNLTELLKGKRYPGRFIAIGGADEGVLGIYGVTARKDHNQARALEQRGDSVVFVPTNSTLLSQGDTSLTVYCAIRPQGRDTLIANARHIEDANVQDLRTSLSKHTYEPDPSKTARITGAVKWDAQRPNAQMHIIRDVGTGARHNLYKVPLGGKNGSFISTYSGFDTDPAHPFYGVSRPVTMNFENPREAVEAVYESLKPPAGEKDYRVSVAAIGMPAPDVRQIAIINRHSTRG